MNVVILAGGVLDSEDSLNPLLPPESPKNKSFLPLHGKPMLQWVLDTMQLSKYVGNIVLVGVGEEAGFTSAKPVYFLPDHGTIIENIIAGVQFSSQISPDASHSMIASGDIPTIEPEMVDWVIKNASDSNVDIFYHVVTQEIMEQRFPGSNRTFAPLKDLRVCGGDLNVVSHRAVTKNIDLWEELTAARKSVFKQAAIFGPRLLLGLLFRSLDLDQLAAYLSKRLGIEAKAVICPYAEIAMDVDKPHQLEIIRKEVGG
ncbi:MAG: nucleotidyltransferase family protein [Anaerolineales bacterium]|jgi:CTP:molybdopterin cytidylyltransferase MocA